MVQNFSNVPARPRVFVYCSGRKIAELQPTAGPKGFAASKPGIFGVMWRAADVTTLVAPDGSLTCSVQAPDTRAVTVDDPAF